MPQFMLPGSPEENSIWEKIIRNNSNAATPLDGNFNSLVNQNIMAGQPAESSFNPMFDPATLNQPKAGPMVQTTPGGPKAVLKAQGNPVPDLPGGMVLPTNPFLSSMTGSAGASAQRKGQAEGMIYDLLKNADSNSATDEQKQAVKDYAEKLKKYEDAPVGGLGSLNISSLASLADAWSGSKLAAGYQAPETPQERNQKLLAYKTQLAQMEGSISKEQNDVLKDKLTTLVGVDKANKDGGFASAMFNRVDETNHRTNLQDIKNNSQIKLRLQQSTNLANSLSALDNATVKTPQQFDTVQQSIRANMGIKGTSGLDERERDYFNNIGLKSDRVEQWLFNKPVDIGESQADVIAHLRQLVQIEQKNIRSQAAQILDTQSSGDEAMYQRRQDLEAGRQKAMKAALSQFDPVTLAPGLAPSKYDGMTDEQIQKLHQEKFGGSK